jgi:hypothetical protein
MSFASAIHQSTVQVASHNFAYVICNDLF